MNHLITFLKSIVVYPLSVLFFILWLVLIIIVTIFLSLVVIAMPSSRWNKILTRLWGKIGVYLALSRVIILNRENFSVEDPVIIITNHRSVMDIFLGVGFFEKDFLFLSKKEVFSIPFVGKVIHNAGFIPVDRGSPRKAALSVIKMTQAVKSGKNILIYPEGTRNYKSDQILPLKSGATVVALKTGATILPIVVYDTAKLYSSANKFSLFPQQIKVNVLKPITILDEMHPSNEKSGIAQPEKLEVIRNLMQEAFDNFKKEKK